MAVKDPQNPPRTVPNASLVTNRNPASLAFGLAPIMTDGPLTRSLGIFSAAPPTTTPSSRPGVENPGSVAKPPGVVNVGTGPFP